MNDKLVEEVEKRAEIQHAKEALNEELEDLTKKLFEEANILVATEAKKAYEHQTREKHLAVEVEQLKVSESGERERERMLVI